MIKYRSREEIAADILKSALEGKRKTHIIFDARLSFAQLSEYLGILVQQDLLEHLPRQELYRTTRKGRYFLERYQEIGQVLSDKNAKDRFLSHDGQKLITKEKS